MPKSEEVEYLYMPGSGVGHHKHKGVFLKPGDKVTTATNLAKAFPDRFCVAADYMGSERPQGLGEEVTDHDKFKDSAMDGLRVFRQGSKYYVYDDGDLSAPMNTEDELTKFDDVVEYIDGLGA